MRQNTLWIFILFAIIFNGCRNEKPHQERSNYDKQKDIIRIIPLNHFQQVDKLLSEIAESPQLFNVSTSKESKVTGTKGTIIHVDPTLLEAVDNSPLGDSIQIELLEMTDNSSLLLNNAQTISNGQILVTGGAYYLNMTSKEKQLKIKQGKGLKVEFPKLSENEMQLFLGERDSLGQINWISTNNKFRSKTPPVEFEIETKNKTKTTIPIKPIKAMGKDNRVLSVVFEDSLMIPELQHYNNAKFRVNDDCEFNQGDADNVWYNVEISKSKVEGEYIIVFEGFNEKGKMINKKYEVTPVFEGEDYNLALKEYEDKYNEYIKRKAEIEFQRKTYESIEIMNFGLINCDRYLNDPSPKTDIQLLVNNDSITGARIYAVFKDINSIMTEQYFKGRKDTLEFRNIPTGKELHIIALSAKDETPYIFETTINTKTTRQIRINFVATTPEDIKKKIRRIN